MIEKYSFDGEDFLSVLQFESWKIGILRYSERFSSFSRLERHNLTDEAFILLEGSATLYTDTESVEMQKCVVYNIKKGVWHHIVVDENTTVMVVENSSTSSENTDIKFL
ncbi:MAG: cupin [Clostridia bacterium]|nr:cupin [Clostridia bacterium]